MSIREGKTDYSLVVPTLEKPPLKRKLDEIETTTVWIFPEKDFEKLLNKNVIDRYSNGRGYSSISFVPSLSNKLKCTKRNTQKSKGLLYIRAPFLNDSSHYSNIEQYLDEIKKIVDGELSNINNGGFLVIQTQDIRIDRYVEPLAKRIVDLLMSDILWLKEIIVVTKEKQNSEIQTQSEYLKIIHHYLLVYEKRGNKDG